jgi:DNA-binding helix-hairpin-helix protein with protein kinase domain
MNFWNSLERKVSNLLYGPPAPQPVKPSAQNQSTPKPTGFATTQPNPIKPANRSGRAGFTAKPTRLKAGDCIYSANRIKAVLGEEIASGGEGRVFALVNKPGVLIKIYKKNLLKSSALKEAAQQRIEAMAGVTALAKHRRFAWPRYPVFDQQSEFIGFGMARLPGHNLHAIGSLAQIREKFPTWDRTQLVRIALNLVSGLHFLHAHQVIVGDLNPGNIQFCEQELKTYFIDCDSYQIKTEQALFPAPGFVDLYTAPEILKSPSSHEIRSPESEYFSASILVFYLLMFGLHPFARRGEGDPVTNMLQGMSPWLDDELLHTPMGSWNGYWRALPLYVRNQFIRAFAKPRWPDSRPDLASWQTILSRYLKDILKKPGLGRIPDFDLRP